MVEVSETGEDSDGEKAGSANPIRSPQQKGNRIVPL